MREDTREEGGELPPPFITSLDQTGFEMSGILSMLRVNQSLRGDLPHGYKRKQKPCPLTGVRTALQGSQEISKFVSSLSRGGNSCQPH